MISNHVWARVLSVACNPEGLRGVREESKVVNKSKYDFSGWKPIIKCPTEHIDKMEMQMLCEKLERRTSKDSFGRKKEQTFAVNQKSHLCTFTTVYSEVQC